MVETAKAHIFLANPGPSRLLEKKRMIQVWGILKFHLEFNLVFWFPDVSFISFHFPKWHKLILFLSHASRSSRGEALSIARLRAPRIYNQPLNENTAEIGIHFCLNLRIPRRRKTIKNTQIYHHPTNLIHRIPGRMRVAYSIILTPFFGPFLDALLKGKSLVFFGV